MQADNEAVAQTFSDSTDIVHLMNLFGSGNQSKVSSLGSSRLSRVGASPMLSKTSVNSAKFGEGTNIKQWLTDNKDFSVANTLKIS